MHHGQGLLYYLQQNTRVYFTYCDGFVAFTNIFISGCSCKAFNDVDLIVNVVSKSNF